MNRAASSYRKLVANPVYYLRVAAHVLVRMRDPLRTLSRFFFLSPVPALTFRNGLHITTPRPADVHTFITIFFHHVYGDVGTGKTIIDIGANIGLFALYAAHDKDNSVYAFEPSPANWETLKRNVEANASRARITIVNQGVRAARGTFPMAAELGPSSRIYRDGEQPVPGETPALVECITLQDIFDRWGIGTCDLLKIDCEGCEYEILFSAPDSLLDRIREIRMECHPLDDQRDRRTMERFLRAKGYAITYAKGWILFARRD